MKKTLLFLLLIPIGLFGQCPIQEILLDSQAAVDNFSTNFPGCTQPIESLVVSGSDITNLSGLSQIDAFFGALVIRDNPLLENLDGLGSIDFLDGSSGIAILNNPILSSIDALQNSSNSPDTGININNNPLLTSLQGFSGFNDALGGIFISNSPGITNLSGLEGITSLRTLDLSSNDAINDITALGNVEGSLEDLRLFNNPSLTGLEGLEGLTDIRVIELQGTSQITNLNPLSGVTNANEDPAGTEIRIQSSTTLTDIAGLGNLDPSTFFSVDIRNNTQLANCAVLSLCNFIAAAGNVTIENNAEGCNSLEQVEESCMESFNLIRGSVQLDSASNGCDITDPPVPGVLIETTDGVNTFGTWSNLQGEYVNFIPLEGTFITSINPSTYPAFFDVSPLNVESTFLGFGNEEVIDFCFTATSQVNDLKITLIPLNPPIPSEMTEYELIYENIGSTFLDADVTLEFDETRQSFESSDPVEVSVVNNLITWSFTSIPPFQSGQIRVVMNTFGPPANVPGDLIELRAFIEDEGDESPVNNRSVLEQIILGDYDRTAVAAAQGESIMEEEVGEFVDYIIRFRNDTGSQVETLQIEQLLSDNLAWETIRPLSSSHPYQIEIVNGDVLNFVFENIDLPSTSARLEESEGFVAFQVRTNENLVAGDQIDAFATLYFDAFDPVVTSTQTILVEEDLSTDTFNLNQVHLYPNPVRNVLQISFSKNEQLREVIVYSTLGDPILRTTSSELDVSKLASGLYFVQIKLASGTIVKKLIKT